MIDYNIDDMNNNRLNFEKYLCINNVYFDGLFLVVQLYQQEGVKEP